MLPGRLWTILIVLVGIAAYAGFALQLYRRHLALCFAGEENERNKPWRF